MRLKSNNRKSIKVKDPSQPVKIILGIIGLVNLGVIAYLLWEIVKVLKTL